jgi:hypothetical protein
MLFKMSNDYSETRVAVCRNQCIQVDTIIRERRPYKNLPGHSYSGFALTFERAVNLSC